MRDTEQHTVYETTCQQCVADLYRTAYLALVDSAVAERIVTDTCVRGVSKYGNSRDPIEIRYNLLSDLVRRCRRCREFSVATGASVPEPYRALSAEQRLALAARTLFGYEI